MNLEILSLAKNKLKKFIQDKEIEEVLLFGSAVKGKADPNDIDVALITKKEIKPEIKGFHISIINPEDFYKNPPSLINTLMREGYSLKKNAPLAEKYGFINKLLFTYELRGLKESVKVKVVNLLRGINGKSGFVKENNGEWLSNGVFIVPLEAERIIERFLINFSVNYKKRFVLIH
jgi:predicted nucleotidyltransferase